MPSYLKIPKLVILVLLVLALSFTAAAQDDPDRQRAFQLYKEAK